MNEEILKEALIAEGYLNTTALDSTIDRLLNLKGTPKTLFLAWIDDGTIPHFDAIEGVDSEFLRKKLQMKSPAVILAYSMLLENPKENAQYFRYLSENRIGFYPNKID